MSDQNRAYTVKYVYGTYEGTVTVMAAESDDSVDIIAKARRLLQPHMTLPMAYERWTIMNKDA